MENSKEKAVIYARYSSERQTEQSIDGQLRECEIYAQNKGLSIIGKYIDRALTGKVDRRPDFQRMIKDSQKRLFDYVLVYQLDRFARNKYDSAIYKNTLKKNGVKVLSAKENINDDPSGILMESVLEGMAEYYSAELAQKVKRGLYEGFLKGHAGGSSCFGYDFMKKDPSRNAKIYVINKTESVIVKRIFDEYASGKMIKDIIKGLNIDGIVNRRKKPFCYNSIMQILTNVKYIGTLIFGTEKRENAIPRIIDDETFAKVKARTDRNKRNPSTYKAPIRYLLSTKAYCGYCKEPFIADSGKKPNGTIYRYYKCHAKKKLQRPCEKTQVKKEWLEFEIVKATMQLLQQKGMIEKIADQVVAYNDELQINPKIALYQKQLAECEKALENIMRAIEQGIFNELTQDRILKLQSEKADLIWRLDGEKLNKPIKLDRQEVIFWFSQFANGNTGDEQFRERLIDTFINKVIVWNEYAIITYNIKGKDNEKITVDQIIADFEKEKAEPQKFDLFQCGSGGQIRTADLRGMNPMH